MGLLLRVNAVAYFPLTYDPYEIVRYRIDVGNQEKLRLRNNTRKSITMYYIYISLFKPENDSIKIYIAL